MSKVLLSDHAKKSLKKGIVTRRQFIKTVLAISIVSPTAMFMSSKAMAAKQSFRPSIVQGFNFQKNNQDLIGHIVELKIGGVDFKADLAVQDPLKIEKGNKVNVVGVVSAIRWDGGFAEPITFTCQVGYAIAKLAAAQTHQSLSNTDVELKFAIYKYDPKEKKYYKCFYADKKSLKGLIEKNGGSLEYEMDIENQNMQVPSPINFELYLSIMPQEEEQGIHLAVSASDKLIKKWGVTRPGKG